MRRNGIGRCSKIQAVPSDIRASAIVSQPFSSAKVSASASAPSVPVANKAIEKLRPGRSSRRVSASVATARVAASTTARIANGMERSRWAMRAYRATSSASGVNTPAADHTTGTTAFSERPCARKPAAPKPIAKIAAVTRCHDTDAPSGFGPIEGSAPPGSTRRSGLSRSAHSANTRNTVAAAAPTAPLALGARQATASVAATSTVKPISARPSWKLASTTSIAPSR